MVLVAVVVVLALVAGVAVIALVIGSNDEPAAAAEVTLEPIDSTGANPFMASVGTDVPDVQPPADTGGTFPGDTEGLFGGTTDESSCDARRMVSFLERHPTEASAWARVLDIEVSGIADYVDTLTPVVLRADTAVTNHGLRDGEPTSFQAVLQAGTAVMVDAQGVPRVKCGCGNPLLPPQRTSGTRYRGDRWPGFDPDRITVVQAATTQISIFVLVDVVTNEPINRPAGTNGGQDSPGSPGTGGTVPTTSPPTTGPTTTTGPPSSASFDGTYAVTATGCDLTSFTLTVSGTSVTVTASGQSFSGTVAADGSFEISDATGGIFGRFESDSVTGTLQGTDCTGTFTGQRTG